MSTFNLVIPTVGIDSRLLKVIALIKKEIHSHGVKYRITLVLNPVREITTPEEDLLSSLDVKLIMTRQGLGNALRASYLANDSDVFVFVPDDLPFGFQEIESALAFDPDKEDLLVFTKYKNHSNHSLRLSMGRLFHFLSRCLFRISVSDTQCSFIASRRTIKLLSQKCREGGYLITLENILIAQASNLNIREISAIWKDSDATRKSTLRLRDPVIMACQLISLRIRFLVIKNK